MKYGKWIAIFAVLAVVGCSDDPSTDDNDNQWDLNGDAGVDADNGEVEDAEFAEDAGPDEDADESEDVGPDPEDVGPDDDVDVPSPDEVTPEMLIGDPWYGVWRLTDDPAVTGMYIGIEFVDEENLVIHGAEEDPGNWEILASGDVHVYNLDGEIEQFMLEPDLGDDGLRGLEVFLPVEHVDAYTLRYEQRGEADIAFDDLGARWQAKEMITGEEGDEYYIAFRIDADGIMELGVTGEEGNFWGFVEGPGVTHTYTTGETFWAMLTDPDVPQAAPIAGEIGEDGDELVLYMFAEDYGDDDPGGGGPPGDGGDSEMVVVELESVSQFGD